MSRIIRDFWGKILSPLYVGEREFLDKLVTHLNLAKELLTYLRAWF